MPPPEDAQCEDSTAAIFGAALAADTQTGVHSKESSNATRLPRVLKRITQGHCQP
jgi:hypothetical protein